MVNGLMRYPCEVLIVHATKVRQRVRPMGKIYFLLAVKTNTACWQAQAQKVLACAIFYSLKKLAIINGQNLLTLAHRFALINGNRSPLFHQMGKLYTLYAVFVRAQVLADRIYT